MKKQTGIIRRIDDLGRIVIPKMFREKLKIEEGQPFEIYLTENGFVLDMYKPEFNKKEIAEAWFKCNQQLLNRYKPQFFRYGQYTSCAAIVPGKNNHFSLARAKCALSDEYDYNIGKIISFCRAIDKPELIPEEFFE